MKKPSSGGGSSSAKGPGRRSGGHRSAHTGQASGSGKAPHKKKYPYTLKQIRQYNRRHHHKSSRGLSLDGIEETMTEFGRTAPHDPFTHPRLVIDRFMDTAALPAPPPTVDRASKVASWPMYGNDTLPDCTFATVGHEIQAWTAYGMGEVTPSEADIEAAFRATGPVTEGRNVQDVLAYWQKTGVAGHQVGGYAQLTGLDNLTLAKQCLNLFGTVYLGIEVPESAMEQFQAGKPWSYVGDRNIVGGHAIPVQYWTTDVTGEIEVVTWGQRQKMTRRFWYEYAEEAWVVFSNDQFGLHDVNPDGLDVAQLRADYMLLTGHPASF